MIKFILLLGAMLLTIACAKQEEEVSPQDIGTRFELKDIKEIKSDEKNAIFETCSALSQKEENFRSLYADKEIVFNFSSSQKGCGSVQSIDYITNAKVIHQNGQMVFNKLITNAVIFDDIILRNDGPLKKFCDLNVGDGLVKRYIQDKKTLHILYAFKKNTDLFIAVETAQDLDNDGAYVTVSKEQIRMVAVANKYQGIVRERLMETSLGCEEEQKQSLTTKLLRIDAM